MSRRRYRVLLAENTIRGLGGSYESLYITATTLDRSRFEPIVLFFQSNHFVARLEAQGIRVILARSRQFWEREEYIQKTGAARARLPRHGMLGGLRRRLVAFARTILGGIPMALTILRILRRERIDLLHTNNNLQRDAMMVLGGVLARVPVVAHERQLAPCTGLARILSSRVRVLVCISEAVLAHTAQNGTRTGVRRRVYNAIDMSSLENVTPGLPPGPPRIGIVGRIMPKKGQRYFLEAAGQVKQRFPEAQFYVVGQATGEDRAYEAELRELTRSSGLEPCVHFTGHLAEPLRLMAAFDVAVHAAIEPEPFGRVLIEAMALGCPLVATALGGPVEIVEDGISGFLVPPRDGAAMAAKIAALLESRALRAEMGAAALRRAAAFGVGAYIRSIEAIYDQALSRRR